uniref:NADH dehydrogenase [ubiquinone] 1 beta subcomplex subunit 11, mitochondrial n=1 Tax=Tabanus bromius TaxID=304241 RepID=A0A0K8TPL1_TABBR
MAGLVRLNSTAFLKTLRTIQLNTLRSISTSPKNRETATISQSVTDAKTETASGQKKNWVSYGFDYKDEARDRSSMKASFFFSVTLCIVWGTFIWAYLPDTQLRDWAQREGFLELRRREAAGLDLISPNYVDPSQIALPSDEELGDTEIII